MSPGQEIELTGPWGLAQARIEKIDQKPQPTLWVTLLSPFEAPPDSAQSLLALSLIRSSRFDWAVEKATELGVKLLVPIMAHRSVPLASGQTKLSRWLRLSEESRKQCGRPNPMDIRAPMTLENFFQMPLPGPKFLADPAGSPQASPPDQAFSLLIGPEGGFTDQEKQLAYHNGFMPYSLGPLTLRSETAAVALLAKLLIK
jgi:16S rRNA (uracil1498-N3)-methyltransferase